MYAPERIVSNKWFDQQLGEDVSTWLEETAKIYERRWTEPEESTADLVEKAALEALKNAGLGADQLDLIIVATDTPEYVSPSTASVVQHRLGAKKAGTFDLNSACAGFVTALDIAATYLMGRKEYQYILVVGAYAMSKYLNLEDKKTVTLFADGAAAMILEASEKGEGFHASTLYTQGQYHDGMGIYSGGTFRPISEESMANKDHLLKFVYRFPKTLNKEEWSKIARELVEKSGLALDDIDHYFFTQINYQTIIQTMEELGQDPDKAQTVMHHYGYTGSACIPMAFCERLKEGKVKRGDKMLFIGSGGGLAFAGACFTY